MPLPSCRSRMYGFSILVINCFSPLVNDAGEAKNKEGLVLISTCKCPGFFGLQQQAGLSSCQLGRQTGGKARFNHTPV